MTNPEPAFVPVTYETHHSLRWQRHADYQFCSNQSVVPIVLQELPKAVMALPIAFVKRKDGFSLVAVLGLEAGKNLFIAQDGRWLGPYVPAMFRCNPFRLARISDKQLVLCIDKASPLINPDQDGEIFFTEDKQLGPVVTEVVRLLQQIEDGDIATTRALNLLHKYDLFQPWDASFMRKAGMQVVNGLYKINEDALRSLSGEALAALNSAGALPIIYCQLLSIQHLPLLGQLADAHLMATEQKQKAQDITQSKHLDIEFLNRDGVLNFGTFL